MNERQSDEQAPRHLDPRQPPDSPSDGQPRRTSPPIVLHPILPVWNQAQEFVQSQPPTHLIGSKILKIYALSFGRIQNTFCLSHPKTLDAFSNLRMASGENLPSKEASIF